MKEQLQYLDRLLESLPSSSSCRGFSDLNGILSNYNKILDIVNAYDDDYKRATTVYYKAIATIRDNIEQALYAASQREKINAFECARQKLKTDIVALTILVRPREELAEMVV